jgi:anionic cell wall polymer biosynthesis LytR-Cps2A-Psr (LCP) family protein
MRREQKGALFLLLILAVIIIFSVVLIFSLRTDPVAENLKKDRVVKVLFVMENAGKVLSTNIFVYYSPSRRAALINIPGNTGAIYASLGRVDRIDAIYAQKGIDVYKTEIEKLCGIEIPFYIIIKLDDFMKLTDMMGGMKVLVPAPVDAVSDSGERWLLPSGAVSLDGDKIATYLTYSLTDETDTDVMDRRQNVLIAFLSALNQNASVMLTKSHFRAYQDKFLSNIDYEGVRKLFSEIAGVDSERIVPQTVTGTERQVDNKKLLFPYYDGQLVKDVIKQSMNLLISQNGTMASRIYVLEIKNGTNVQGLAHNTAALLQSAGYDVLTTLNADSNDTEKTEIIDHIGNADAARSLGDFIHCKNIVEEAVEAADTASDSSDAADVDFTIILGRDFDGRYVH